MLCSTLIQNALLTFSSFLRLFFHSFLFPFSFLLSPSYKSNGFIDPTFFGIGALSCLLPSSDLPLRFVKSIKSIPFANSSSLSGILMLLPSVSSTAPPLEYSLLMFGNGLCVDHLFFSALSSFGPLYISGNRSSTLSTNESVDVDSVVLCA